MAADDKKQPIIVKRVKKGGHAAHHGGSWKVAYADFVTAMMAFFLLLWLLSQVPQISREGISEFFKNPTGIQGPGGASTSMIKLGGAMDMARGEDTKKQPQDKTQVVTVVRYEKEKEKLEELLQEVKRTIETSAAMRQFKDQILLDITDEGLRIQIIDKKNRPMFASASAVLKPYTKQILHEIARVINKVPNKLSVSGHTDGTPFVKGYYREYDDVEEKTQYTNWELSADRANAARRELLSSGARKDKISRVTGLADSVPFDGKNPGAPANRRISIIVLNQKTEDNIKKYEGRGDLSAQELEKLISGANKN